MFKIHQYLVKNWTKFGA